LKLNFLKHQNTVKKNKKVKKIKKKPAAKKTKKKKAKKEKTKKVKAKSAKKKAKATKKVTVDQILEEAKKMANHSNEKAKFANELFKDKQKIHNHRHVLQRERLDLVSW